MFKIFKKKEEDRPFNVAAGKTAPGSGIQYSPKLIKELEDDHKALVNLYKEAANAIERRDGAALRRNLGQLKDSLTGHLLKENLKLYAYMNHCYRNDAEGVDLIKGFRNDMTQIGKVVFNFLSKYTAPGAKFDLAFKKEFDAIGEALVRRIESEEKQLYPLYMSPENYE